MNWWNALTKCTYWVFLYKFTCRLTKCCLVLCRKFLMLCVFYSYFKLSSRCILSHWSGKLKSLWERELEDNTIYKLCIENNKFVSVKKTQKLLLNFLKLSERVFERFSNAFRTLFWIMLSKKSVFRWYYRPAKVYFVWLLRVIGIRVLLSRCFELVTASKTKGNLKRFTDSPSLLNIFFW